MWVSLIQRADGPARPEQWARATPPAWRPPPERVSSWPLTQTWASAFSGLAPASLGWLFSHSVMSDSLRPHGFPSVHGILQARILEWVVISSSRGSSQPTDQTPDSCMAGRLFASWATMKPDSLRTGAKPPVPLGFSFGDGRSGHLVKLPILRPIP